MNKPFLLLSFFLLACSSRQITPRYINNQHNIDHINNSVVQLVGINSLTGNREPFCSAFFISPNRIASANHCFTRVENIEIMPGMYMQRRLPPTIGASVSYVTYQEWQVSELVHRTPRHLTAVVAGFDVEEDVAILTTQTRNEEFLDMNSSTIRQGQRVYAVGHPVGLPWLLTEGIVSRVFYHRNGSIDRIRATPDIFFGNSGGPIVNNHGEVLGTASGIASRQSFLGIYSPIRNIVRLNNLLDSIENRR